MWNGAINDLSDARVIFELECDDRGLVMEVFMSDEFQRVGGNLGGERIDGLWEFDVAELFIIGEKGEYTEFEIDRLGNFLVLRFEKVRVRSDELTDLHLDIETSILADGVLHKLILPAEILPEKIERVNGVAIIDNEQFLSAVKLSGDEPDFHQIEQGFKFEV